MARKVRVSRSDAAVGRVKRTVSVRKRDGHGIPATATDQSDIRQAIPVEVAPTSVCEDGQAGQKGPSDLVEDVLRVCLVAQSIGVKGAIDVELGFDGLLILNDPGSLGAIAVRRKFGRDSSDVNPAEIPRRLGNGSVEGSQQVRIQKSNVRRVDHSIDAAERKNAEKVVRRDPYDSRVEVGARRTGEGVRDRVRQRNLVAKLGCLR